MIENRLFSWFTDSDMMIDIRLLGDQFASTCSTVEFPSAVSILVSFSGLFHGRGCSADILLREMVPLQWGRYVTMMMVESYNDSQFFFIPRLVRFSHSYISRPSNSQHCDRSVRGGVVALNSYIAVTIFSRWFVRESIYASDCQAGDWGMSGAKTNLRPRKIIGARCARN